VSILYIDQVSLNLHVSASGAVVNGLGGKWFERRRLLSSRKTKSSVRLRGIRPDPSVNTEYRAMTG
jgi:hypothetical protein